MTLIPYLLTRDESESHIPFHRLNLTGQSPEDLVTLELRDSHCINLDCPCDVSWLSVSRIETDAGQTWGAQARALRLGISVKNGQFQPAESEAPLDQLLRQALGPQLNPDLLGALRERRQQTREWGKENGWLYRDWSHLKPGARVGWVEVFPATETLTVDDGETRYALDEQYCCEPGCGCRDIVLVIVRMGVEAGVAGYLSYDYVLDSSRKIEWGQTTENKLQEILQIFFQHFPTLKAELPRRAEFMSRSFAAFLANQRANAGPPQNAARAGRNDPCPCGSGKKYKKCCGSESGQVS